MTALASPRSKNGFPINRVEGMCEGDSVFARPCSPPSRMLPQARSNSYTRRLSGCNLLHQSSPSRTVRTAVSTQGVERLINHCLGFVIRFLEAATIDEIYALNESEKKNTLGKLLSKLRERVSVEASFDSLLKSFLKNRNTFVHEMSFLPGWTLETEAGRRVAIEFLERYSQELSQVHRIFVAFVREDRSGRQAHIPKGSESFFAIIDKLYVPLVSGLVGPNLKEPKKTRSKKK